MRQIIIFSIQALLVRFSKLCVLDTQHLFARWNCCTHTTILCASSACYTKQATCVRHAPRVRQPPFVIRETPFPMQALRAWPGPAHSRTFTVDDSVLNVCLRALAQEDFAEFGCCGFVFAASLAEHNWNYKRTWLEPKWWRVFGHTFLGQNEIKSHYGKIILGSYRYSFFFSLDSL